MHSRDSRHLYIYDRKQNYTLDSIGLEKTIKFKKRGKYMKDDGLRRTAESKKGYQQPNNPIKIF